MVLARVSIAESTGEELISIAEAPRRVPNALTVNTTVAEPTAPRVITPIESVAMTATTDGDKSIADIYDEGQEAEAFVASRDRRPRRSNWQSKMRKSIAGNQMVKKIFRKIGINPYKMLDAECLEEDCTTTEMLQEVENIGAGLKKDKLEVIHDQEFKNIHGDANDLTERVADPEVYLPFCRILGMPFKLSAHTDFLGHVTKLSEEVPEVLQLPKTGRAQFGQRLVPITQSSPEYFLANAKQYLPKVLDAAVVGDMSMDERASTLMKAIKHNHPQAFEDVAKTKQLPKMDPYSQLAMQLEGGASDYQMKIGASNGTRESCYSRHTGR